MKISARLSVRVTVFALLCFWLTSTMLHAQMRVGQPSGAPDGSAALDVSGGPYSSGSAYRGLLPPKVALTQTTQATPVTAPSTGLLVYNTAQTGDVTPGYYYWEGKKWARLSTTAAGAGRVGVAGDPLPTYTLEQARSLTNAPSSYNTVSPQVFMLTDEGKQGLFRYDMRLTYADPGHPELYADDDGVMVIVTAGRSSRGDRTTYSRIYDGEINVRWFGAKGDGVTDDSQAIQAAIDYARSKGKIAGKGPLFAGHGGQYRATVLIPEGIYFISRTIDVTQASGIVVKGVGGRYINTIVSGATGGSIFDFTGSSLSGCENLTLQSYEWEPNHSTIGVQFALGDYGGLSCEVKNCYFQMADDPAANNGTGTIGVVNCRSEEFTVTGCVIRANVGCIFTYTNNLNEAGLSYTISSPYATVVANTGSMGIVNFSGQNTIMNYGKARPALILNGTNSFYFHGFMSRQTLTGNGTNETAVLFSGPVTYNATINGTVESFAQLIRIQQSSLINSIINGVVANQTTVGSSLPAGTTRPPVIGLSGGARIQGSKISVTFGNGRSEMGGRYLLYADEPAVGYNQIMNSEINCHDWITTSLIASTSLMKNTENTIFKTAYPFEKKSVALMNSVINSQNFSTAGWTTNTYNQIVPNGVLSPTKLYVMKLVWGQAGVDQIVQSYVLPMSGTDYNGNPAAQVLPVLTPNTISWGNSGRSISVRYKAPSVTGQTSYGLEAAISNSDMNNGTLSITVAPLL